MKPHPDCPAPHVGVGLALHNAAGAILFGKRTGGMLAGAWAFPGGKVDPGEDPSETALRECEEETGLRMENIGSLTLVHTSTNELDGHWYVTIFFSARYYEPEHDVGPRVMEPTKCEEWRWFPVDAIPSPLMPGTSRFLNAGGIF